MQARHDEGLFRLAVDRVFTLAGHGTVVAGTVFSGQICTGDTVILMPANTPVRVRSIHAQNRAADRGHAGQRCALNRRRSREERDLTWRLARRSSRSSRRRRVSMSRLRLLADSDSATWQRGRRSTCTSARRTASRMWSCWSRTVSRPVSPRAFSWSSTRPVCALPGDRFIARDAQAAHTVGGGVGSGSVRAVTKAAVGRAPALSRCNRTDDRRRRRRAAPAGRTLRREM